MSIITSTTTTTTEPPHPLSRKPTKSLGPQSWLLILCTCCTFGLGCGAAGGIIYSLALSNSDLSSWEAATCELERVDYMTTETSWDPFFLMDTERTGISTSWGVGIYVVVMVSTNVTGRKFTSGGNNCGVFTYSDGCECRNNTCYNSRLGDIRWDECPNDPWCDVTKVVKGPCVDNATRIGSKCITKEGGTNADCGNVVNPTSTSCAGATTSGNNGNAANGCVFTAGLDGFKVCRLLLWLLSLWLLSLL